MPAALRRRYAALLDPGAPPFCLAHPATGDCLAANDAFCALLGLPPGGLTGSRLTNWLAEGAQGPVAQEFLAQLASLAGGGGWARQDWPLRTGAGEARAVRLAAVAERGAVALHAAAQVAEEQRRLSRLKDEFLSLAAHELKTPITSIKIFSELAARRPEAIEPRVMRALTHQADKLATLVDDLLDVSRLDLGRMRMEMRDFDLAALLRDLVERGSHVYPGCELAATLPEGPAVIHGDASRIEQVFNNLLDNAAKYSPARGRIGLECRLQGGEVAVSVRDNGIGIAPLDLPHIFERFYKPSSQQAVYPGLGLGLYVSREITLRHGGRILAESEPGRGSAFHVWLPQAAKS